MPQNATGRSRSFCKLGLLSLVSNPKIGWNEDLDAGFDRSIHYFGFGCEELHTKESYSSILTLEC